ncbi:MAG: DUF1269 domain-containing protein [Actinomycetota bacterium]|nr:DUF1269 domain-containing protein [Actinomycetota bacterium]
MGADKNVFLFAATYPSEGEARLDYEVLKELHAEGVVGTYDAAIVTKSADGKVHVHKHEKPTQHAAWTGIAVGAVVGILFPPSLIGSAAVLGVAGGVMGHLWKGMSRADVKELGDLIDEGDAALVVVGESKIEKYLDRAMSRATKRIAKQVEGDANAFADSMTQASNDS